MSILDDGYAWLRLSNPTTMTLLQREVEISLSFPVQNECANSLILSNIATIQVLTEQYIREDMHHWRQNKHYDVL